MAKVSYVCQQIRWDLVHSPPCPACLIDRFGDLGSTVNCNLLSLQPTCCKSCAIDLLPLPLLLLLLYRFRWPSLLLLPWICLVLFNQRIRPDSVDATDTDESSVRPFGWLAQLMISYESCGKQDNAETAQSRAKRMPQQRGQHKDGKRSKD